MVSTVRVETMIVETKETTETNKAIEQVTETKLKNQNCWGCPEALEFCSIGVAEPTVWKRDEAEDITHSANNDDESHVDKDRNLCIGAT